MWNQAVDRQTVIVSMTGAGDHIATGRVRALANHSIPCAHATVPSDGIIGPRPLRSQRLTSYIHSWSPGGDPKEGVVEISFKAPPVPATASNSASYYRADSEASMLA
uniref:Uncharacterized protein n=1 Tax=Trichuris muris TaxID=70415 RepID=A0A5S6R631_TRIMR